MEIPGGLQYKANKSQPSLASDPKQGSDVPPAERLLGSHSY